MATTPLTFHFKQAQCGFSLLEILISLIILGVGLVSLAFLQTKAMQQNHSSQLRSIAVFQVQGMADRMRANRDGVQAGLYDSISGIPSGGSCGFTCSTTEIAARDAHEWNTDNQLLLPSGQGTVRAIGSIHRITLMWDNDRTGAGGTACSGNSDVDLTCVSMDVEI